MSTVLALGLSLEAFAALPSPAILMYGYSDAGYASMPTVWDEVMATATIIEGTTSDPSLVTRLRSQGKLFTYHVNNTFADNATAFQVADVWAAPFADTLNGQLPGGFDAVCIDELHSTGTDNSTESARVIGALQLLRQRYPNKYIMAAGVWQLGFSGSLYWVGGKVFDNMLRAVRDYCDLFFLEGYLSESNLQLYLFNDMAVTTNPRIPGLLAQTIFGLGITQSSPYAYDNSADINYIEYLDAQFNTIRNNTLTRTMPGVGFWAFYRARPETNLHMMEFCKHYYLQNNTAFYGSGHFYNTRIADSGFENNDNVSWRTSTATSFPLYTQVPTNIVSQHYSMVSHGAKCLKTTRGATPNRIRQIVTVEPGAWYRLSGYVASTAYYHGAVIGAFDYRGEAYFKTEKTYNLVYNYDVNLRWHRINIRFQVPADATKIVIYVSDLPSAQNVSLYWDYFELEKDYLNRVIPEVDF